MQKVEKNTDEVKDTEVAAVEAEAKVEETVDTSVQKNVDVVTEEATPEVEAVAVEGEQSAVEATAEVTTEDAPVVEEVAAEDVTK